MQLTARAWVAATVVLGLILALAAWFLVIDPVRADAAALRGEAADTQARNQQTVERTKVLRRQFANLPQKQAELDELAQALPAGVDLPGLITAIDGFAGETGVTIMSISPGAAAPVVDPAAEAAAAAPAPAPTESAAPTDGSATAPTEPAAPAGPVTIAIPVTTTVIGNFFDAQAFLRQLQTKMPRAYLVRNLSVTAEDQQDAAGGRPATTTGDVTMTITADVFSRPTSAPATSATPPTPAQPGAPSTPAPGGTLTPTPGPAGGAPAPAAPGPSAPLPAQPPAAVT